jgi:hypothetical protein
MRIREIVPSDHELLRVLTARISNRLETSFTELRRPDLPSIGIELRERGKRFVMELPETLLVHAREDRVVRERMRLRIKAQRDRLLFRPTPIDLRSRAVTQAAPAPSGGRDFGPGRRRR